MTARGTASMRPVATAVSQTAVLISRASRRPLLLRSQLSPYRPISSSSTFLTTTALAVPTTHHAQTLPEARLDKCRSTREGGPLSHLSLDDLIRLLTTNYSGKYLEAQDLDQVIADADEWAPSKLLFALPDSHALGPSIRKYIAYKRIKVDTLVAFRNAMLAQNWSDLRRIMISVPERRWPTWLLMHGAQTVATASEISDALALLAMSITESVDRGGASFKSLRHCFTRLSAKALDGNAIAVHLIPRFIDVLLAVMTTFPRQSAIQTGFVTDFVRRCTIIADQRARNAVMLILDFVRDFEERSSFSSNMQGQVLHCCILSIERSIERSESKTSTSERFANVKIMDRTLRLGLLHHIPDLRQRALRSAIFVAGRERNFRLVHRWFDFYEQCIVERGGKLTGSDHLLFAKALIRTEQGRQAALDAFSRAEQLLPSEHEELSAKKNQRSAANRLGATGIDILRIMAQSADVPPERVLSLLGIFVHDGIQRGDGAMTLAGDKFSAAIKRLRSDVYAYTVVMQGVLVRGQPEIAPTVWRAMLDRGVLPNTACLSVLLQNLFAMHDVSSALRQLNIWCEQGVLPPPPGGINKLEDIEVERIAQLGSLPVSSNPFAAFEPATDAEVYKLTPDPVLASVVFSGLHSCGAKGVEALWTAYQETIRLFPDAPVLALLLKTCCQSETGSSMDARFGRQVFRSMLFAKHPELASCHNPLRDRLETESPASWIFSSDSVGARMETWFSSIFAPGEIDAPVTISDLTGLTFTSQLFEHYVRLLLSLEHSPGMLADSRLTRQELLDVLGWMRELHLKPSKTHVALTVLEIEEGLAPAVAARQMDLLDEWLGEWLGEKGMPKEREMQRCWQWKMRRNGQATGWFDRLTGAGHSVRETRDGAY